MKLGNLADSSQLKIRIHNRVPIQTSSFVTLGFFHNMIFVKIDTLSSGGKTDPLQTSTLQNLR